MNKKEQLNAIVRCYGEWPDDAVYALWHLEQVYFVRVGENFAASMKAFTRSEVEARKAELQNKPRWADAPAWANWLAQDSTGIWYWYAVMPTITGSRGFNGKSGTFLASVAGNVIGDWRDTLEEIKREPNTDKPFAQSLTEASMLAHTAQLQADSQEYVETNTADYDMSIHSNPDAAAWAKFFQKTFEEQKWTIDDIDESLMIGWFANAMMAMHDHVLSEKEKTKEHWNGEGLPPVGVEFNFSTNGREWEERVMLFMTV